MTATNYLTFNNGVVLFSDTSVYDPSGTIVRFKSKVRTPEGGKLGIITSGSALLGDKLVAHLERHARAVDGGPLTFDRVVEYLPGCVEVMNRWLDAGGLDRGEDGSAKIAISFAGWSDEFQQWSGGEAFSWEFLADVGPGRVVRSLHSMWPALEIEGDARLLTEIELVENLRALGKAEFVRTVLNLQRRTVLVFDEVANEMARCVIGGDAELVTITESSVTREIVQHWSDEVGDDQETLRARVLAEPIPRFLVEGAPRVVEPVARSCRAERRRAELEQRKAA